MGKTAEEGTSGTRGEKGSLQWPADHGGTDGIPDPEVFQGRGFSGSVRETDREGADRRKGVRRIACEKADCRKAAGICTEAFGSPFLFYRFGRVLPVSAGK